MTKSIKSQIGIWLAALVAFASPVRAQLAPPSGGQSGGALANQVPLSGRTGQSGSVVATQTPVAGATASVNTINPAIQPQGPYTSSVLGTAKAPFAGKLSLREAVQRGLDYNLGTVGLSLAVRQAEGQARAVRSNLMPNIYGTLAESVQQINLRASGLKFNSPIPGFNFPSVVGPYNTMDLRAHLTQTVGDLAALNNYRSAKETLHANEFFAKDAKDLVVLAVGGAYLQVIAARARVESARAQLESANALYDQTAQQRAVGLVTQIDVNKSQVQALTQQQRLATLQNDFAKQKISLARLTGLPPNARYDLTDDIPFADAPVTGEEDAVAQSLVQRADIKAAEAQIRAAERASAAARAERLPSASLSADYGVIGVNPTESHGTFSVTGSLRFPIWQGGRTEGDIEQANAALAQRRAELEDLKSKVESDVRNAFLDLEAAKSQVEVAQKNLDVTRETLSLTRQRFEAGVTDSVDVAQTQATVATAELDYIDAVYAHNVAKLSLARALGGTADSLARFLKLQ